MKYLEYDSEGKVIGFYDKEINDVIPSKTIKIEDELWETLLEDNYKLDLDTINTIQNQVLTKIDKNLFIMYEPEVIEVAIGVDPVKSLAKQVGLLTLENKKKDVQIESLMKAVKALTNK